MNRLTNASLTIATGRSVVRSASRKFRPRSNDTPYVANQPGLTMVDVTQRSCSANSGASAAWSCHLKLSGLNGVGNDTAVCDAPGTRPTASRIRSYRRSRSAGETAAVSPKACGVTSNTRSRSSPASRSARSLRRRTFAARNGSPADDLSHVSGQRRRLAGRGRFSAVGEPKAKSGRRGPHDSPETAMRVDLSPLRASCPALYAAFSTCRRLTFNARHTKSHSPRAFANPRRLKRRKPSTCLIQP